MRAFLILFFFISQVAISQLYSDSAYKNVTVHNNLQEALIDSGSVRKLILKREKLTVFPMDILKLTELEYLDLDYSGKVQIMNTCMFGKVRPIMSHTDPKNCRLTV